MKKTEYAATRHYLLYVLTSIQAFVNKEQTIFYTNCFNFVETAIRLSAEGNFSFIATSITFRIDFTGKRNGLHFINL